MTLKNNLFKALAVALCFCHMLPSCTKEKYDFDKLIKNQWDPEFAIGLVSGSLGVNDLNLTTSNSYLQFAADGSASMVFSNNVSTFTTNDFITSFTSNPSVSQRTLTTSEETGLSNAILGSRYVIKDSQTFDISVQASSKIDIDSIILKTGTLNIHIENTFKDSASITVTLPSVLSNGIPLSQTLSVAPSKSADANFPITGYLIDLTNGGTTSNYLKAKYSISFTKISSDVTGILKYNGQVNNPSLSILYGDVHQQNFFNTKTKSIALDIFKVPQTSGVLKLQDATIKLRLSSSFGVPISFSVSEIKGTNAQNNSFYLNTVGIIPTPKFINSPQVVGSTIYDSLIINKNNPPTNGSFLNLPDFLSKFPTSFLPSFKAVSNSPLPAGKVKNFILDSSKGSVDAEVTVPLSLQLTDYVLRDTLKYNIDGVDNIESFILRTSFNNGLPVGVAVRIYLTDKNYKPIDSIVGINGAASAILLDPAKIDSITGRVISKSPTMLDFTFSPYTVANLGKITSIIFMGTLNSPKDEKGKPQYAKIFKDNTIDVKIGAKVKQKM